MSAALKMPQRSLWSLPIGVLISLLGCAGILIWHTGQYNFITDDAYISFVYARNFAEHGALVFNPGAPPVEGYTNFLWTLLLGITMLSGVPPEISSRILALGFALTTLVIAAKWSRYLLLPTRASSADGATNGDPNGKRDNVGDAVGPAWWSVLAAGFLALSASFACWTSGGLETQMFTCWLALALSNYARADDEPARLPRTGIYLALAAMTRPEGLLVTAVIGLHRLGANLVRERRLLPNRHEWGCLLLFLLLWAPWYGWRWWYYGYPFPNTYYVKAAGTPPPGYRQQLWQSGAYYVGRFARHSLILYALPLVAVGACAPGPGWRRRLSFASWALPLAAVYVLYTASVGGDFMGLYRFVMPVLLLAAVASTVGLATIGHHLAKWIVRLQGQPQEHSRGRHRRSWPRRLVPALLAVAALVAHGQDQIRLTVESLRWGNFASDRGIDTPAFLRIYTADRAAIGAHMQECFRDDDFSIVGGAGAQPYYGRMRAVDVFGLVSSDIAHGVQPTNPRAGHNKWAPDRLLLSFDPTFVFSCYAIHARADAARFNCQTSFWLRNGYEKVTLHIPTLKQSGQYYSFFKKKERDFQCPGLVEQ